MIRLVQLKGPGGRRLAVVEEPDLKPVDGISSIYDLAQVCIAQKQSVRDVLNGRTKTHFPYDDVYAGDSEWRLLPAADHPREPARCLVSGTGLTHVASAKNRNAMHAKAEDLTDSMRMYRWGVEGGKPGAGEIGVPPGMVLQGYG